ncbi:MAG TPA: hypothetical protein VMZ28_08820 [Kofleriaceae bacterium]|nr:hypothetical protein [Kofleriaceae bacterium]
MRALPVLLLVALAGGCQSELGTLDPDDRPAFESGKNAVELLPYGVRLARVAGVLGVTTDDPALAEMRERHLELGDHDFASGVRPNLTWTSSRMSSWVAALMPVCQSEAMRALYPALPADADDLMAAAYGRPATADDLAAIDEGLADVPLDDEERYMATCLAILSSAEFVAK